MIFNFCHIYVKFFSLTYEARRIDQRLPRGVLPNAETFHGGIHTSKKYPMHSCSIFSNDTEFVSNVFEDPERCDVFLHTDYTIMVCSKKLFVHSVRNQDSKYFYTFLILWITDFAFRLSADQYYEDISLAWKFH